MKDVDELDIKHQRQFLIYSHALNSATHLLAKSTNLPQEYWAESLCQLAVETIDSMSDSEVETAAKGISQQMRDANSVQKYSIKRHEN
jgi:hypothetical protein